MQNFKYLDRVRVSKIGHGYHGQSGIVTHGIDRLGEVRVVLDGHEQPIVIKAEGLEHLPLTGPAEQVYVVLGYTDMGGVITMTNTLFDDRAAAQAYANGCHPDWKAFVAGAPKESTEQAARIKQLTEGLHSLRRAAGADDVLVDQINLIISGA